MKLFVRFLLSLFLLLLGWTGGVQAGEVSQAGLLYRQAAIFEQAAHVHLVTVHGAPEQLARSGLAADDEDGDDLEDAADDEEDDSDDESSPFGKHLYSRSYFFSSFFPSIGACNTPVSYYLTSFCKHFSFSLSDTYIVFRAIRI